MPLNILLHGSGAIGTVYVYLLSQAGCDVTAVCRSNYEAAKANGFNIDSKLYGQGLHVSPDIVRTPAEAVSKGPFDYVIVCSKAFPGTKPSTPEIIAPAVTEGKTTIVLIENGIGIEEEYAQVFPHNPLLSCVVYLPATQIAPGKVEMGDLENLQIGTYPATKSVEGVSPAKQSATTLIKTLNSAGGNAQFFEDIQEQRWAKLLINASWNPICGLTLSRDVAVLASSKEAESLVRETMLEVVSIAQTLGHASIDAAFIETTLARAFQRVGSKGIEPSMLVDVLNGRRMEVEVILGNPVRIARDLGLVVPRLETLYVLTKALDEAIALRQPGKSLSGDETALARMSADEQQAAVDVQL